VWFLDTRYGYRSLFPSQDLLEDLNHERPRLLALEHFGAAAYLFGPAKPGVPQSSSPHLVPRTIH
jgi:hypothetical protein